MIHTFFNRLGINGNSKKKCRFQLKDQTDATKSISPNKIYVDGKSAAFSVKDGYVYISVNSKKQFTLKIESDNYHDTDTLNYTYSTLNDTTVYMIPMYRMATFKVVNSKSPTTIIKEFTFHYDGIIKQKDIDYTIDSDGNVSMKVASEGTFNIKITNVTGYIDIEETKTYSSLNGGVIAMVPVQEETDATLVLTWNDKIKDVDSYLLMKATDGKTYTSEYGNKGTWIGDENSKIKLDVDKQDKYGPETITIKPIYKPYTYYYYIHNYNGGSTSLFTAETKCKVTIGSTSTDFSVPEYTDDSLKYWNVCKISNGVISTPPSDKEISSSPITNY